MSAESEYHASRPGWLTPPFRISNGPWIPGPVRMNPAVIQARWKAGWGSAVWIGLLAAAALHAVILTQMRDVRVDPPDVVPGSTVSRLLIPRVSQLSIPALPVSFEVPGPPILERPRVRITPSLAGVPVTPAALAKIEVPATPVTPASRDEWASYEKFAPSMVMPEILNREELRRFLERRYQPLVRYTGIQGTAVMRFWIDEMGLARKAEVHQSTGHRELDELALKLAEVLRFSPAIQNGDAIRVVVEVPIQFRAI